MPARPAVPRQRPGPAAHLLGRPGRRARLIGTAAVFGALLAGTLWGQDDHFPFGPFRMYATTQRLDGRTSWYRIDAVTETGEVVFLSGASYGMRRAELEGQVPRFVEDPSLLGAIAEAHAERRPDAPGLVELRLVKRSQQMEGGRPAGEPTDRVMATWRP